MLHFEYTTACRTMILVMFFAMTSGYLHSQPPAERNRLSDAELGFSTGPAIGATVPDFTLPDQYGQSRNLTNLVGRNGAILNFFRSASW